jgi:hypothetical protein
LGIPLVSAGIAHRKDRFPQSGKLYFRNVFRSNREETKMIRRFWLVPALALACLVLLGVTAQTQGDKTKGKTKTTQQDKDKGKDADKDKGKEKDKDADKDKGKEKDKGKDKEADKGKEKEKDGEKGGGSDLAWTVFEKEGKPFVQVLETDTTQNMTVSGMKNVQQQNQVFWFKWTPKGKEGGKYKVEQEIIGLKMDINIGGNKIAFNSGDKEQKKNPMTQFFKSLEGTKFTLTIDPEKMRVTEVQGVKKMVDRLSQVNQSMKPLLEKILSEEAVKEMANAVLEVLPPKGSDKKEWGSKTTLDMGPIGKYERKNTYRLGEKDEKFATIKVDTYLKYVPPTGEDAKGLPFKIEKATLESEKSGGEIKFDRKKGRIDSTELTVKLKGDLTVNIANTSTTVNLEQNQKVVLHAYDTDAKEIPSWVQERLNEKSKKDKGE